MYEHEFDGIRYSIFIFWITYNDSVLYILCKIWYSLMVVS